MVVKSVVSEVKIYTPYPSFALFPFLLPLHLLNFFNGHSRCKYKEAFSKGFFVETISQKVPQYRAFIS